MENKSTKYKISTFALQINSWGVTCKKLQIKYVTVNDL